MHHKTLEAKVTTTDLGEFTALAAAYSVDRVNERILPGAFKGTIEAWQESGKQIPLHWDHSAAAEDIIGTVDPASMKETEQGLEVKGKLDLDESETAREAWRSMKKNRVGLSFGYLVTDDGEGEDGIRELKSVDLFEVTITPAPANPDTRFIDMKSVATKRALAREFVAEIKELRGEIEERSDLLQDALEDRETKREAEQEVEAVNRLRQDAERLEFEVATRNIDGGADREERPEPSEEREAKETLEEKEDEEQKGSALPVAFPGDELEGARSGELKAVWTAKFINNLPDSAFLYVELGEKDAEGKTTPRSLRHFPVKDASRTVDLPHVRNALARILQSNLSQDVKDRLTKKAQSMLDKEKAIDDARDDEPETVKSEAQDPLRRGYDELALELSTRGIDVAEPPKVEETPTVDDPLSLEEHRRRAYDLMLETL